MVCCTAEYVQLYARPEMLRGRNGHQNGNKKDSEDGDAKMEEGSKEGKGDGERDSEGFLSSSSDEES